METNSAPLGASETVNIGLLDVSGLEFYRNGNGFLCLRQGETDHKRVKLARVLPFTNPYAYISVMSLDNKEIGILRDAAQLPEAQAELVRDELDTRYFCPSVTEIHSIREKMGYFYFDVHIGDYKKLFAVKDISKSIRMMGDDAIMITDVDGNRYLIHDVHRIDAQSRRRLEPYLY